MSFDDPLFLKVFFDISTTLLSAIYRWTSANEYVIVSWTNNCDTFISGLD